MVAQDADGVALQAGVERARDALAGMEEQLRGEVRREIPARRQPVAAGEGDGRQRADLGAGHRRRRLGGDAARALADDLDGGVGPAQQRDQHRGFARVESAGRLAEQPPGRRVETAQFAAVRRELR